MRSEAELTCFSEQLSYASLHQMESNWEPSVGALYVVRYTDGRLYRARIVDIDADTVSMFFIDYGNATCIKRKLIYPSKPEWNVPSPYAIECKLDGIAMVIEDSWTEEAQQMFATYVMDRMFLAQLVLADKIANGNTPVPCYVVHFLEMGMSVRQCLLCLIDNLTEYSEKTEDDESNDTAITALTQVADAGGLLRKGTLKLLTKDMHEYYISHTTSQVQVDLMEYVDRMYILVIGITSQNRIG